MHCQWDSETWMHEFQRQILLLDWSPGTQPVSTTSAICISCLAFYWSSKRTKLDDVSEGWSTMLDVRRKKSQPCCWLLPALFSLAAGATGCTPCADGSCIQSSNTSSTSGALVLSTGAVTGIAVGCSIFLALFVFTIYKVSTVYFCWFDWETLINSLSPGISGEEEYSKIFRLFCFIDFRSGGNKFCCTHPATSLSEQPCV